jgi:general stress protein 26
MSPRSFTLEHLKDLITGIGVAMLTTVRGDGTLRSRPMAPLESEFDGSLWFFTHTNSLKVGEVEEEGQVNVSYADSVGSHYVSISGRAVLVLDRQKLESLWNPSLEAWFPLGLADPLLALLRVDAESGAYWDDQSGAMVMLGAVAKPALPEVVYESGDHQRLDLSGVWVTQDVGNTKNRNEEGI